MATSDARSIAVDLLQRADVAAITTRDVRFGRLVESFPTRLTAITGGPRLLRDVLATFLERPEIDDHAERSLGNLASLIVLAECVPLTVELGWILSAARVQNTRGVMRYYGWDGLGGSTLQVAGDLAGTTRERVRQVADKVEKVLAGGRTFAPVLDRALDLLDEACVDRAFVLADGIENAILESDVATEPFRIEGLMRAAEILGRPLPWQLTRVADARVLLSQDGAEQIAAVHRAARKILDQWGVTTVAEVEAQVQSAVGTGIRPGVAGIVQMLPGFAWLDESTGWFWIGPAFGARLTNQIQKIMAVSPTITLSELRAGIGRPYRMQGFAPPKRVLAALLAARGGYRIDRETVIADAAPTWNVELSGVERILVDLLRQRGGIARREDLEADSIARGVKRGTFYVNLGYSPVIARIAPGIYALRGVSIAPGLVDALVVRKPRRRVLQDYGWTPDSNIWLGYRFSANTVSSGVVSIPSSLASFIEGEFEITDVDGLHLGRLGTADYQAWGAVAAN